MSVKKVSKVECVVVRVKCTLYYGKLVHSRANLVQVKVCRNSYNNVIQGSVSGGCMLLRDATRISSFPLKPSCRFCQSSVINSIVKVKWSTFAYINMHVYYIVVCVCVTISGIIGETTTNSMLLQALVGYTVKWRRLLSPPLNDTPA